MKFLFSELERNAIMMAQNKEWLYKIQERQRQEMLKKIDVAIKYLRSAGIKVTKKNISEEAEISYNTLQQDYIKKALMTYYEFNPELLNPNNLVKENEGLMKKITIIEKELKVEKGKNKRQKLEIAALKGDLAEQQEKYEHLLGEYQIQVGKKIIPF